MRCLRAYLASGGEIKAAAKTLCMHRNSVSYKLQKIASIIDVDLHDAEVRFQLQQALKILDLKAALS
jgi:DNA-binding PucR family transcriptional regulator